MLPPDNFQEDPKPVVAHRTSPTNLGLYLLSVVAARDFGWLGLLDTIERLEATLATHERARALPRPLLQLVRHAGPAPARAEVRLLGGQRESRGPSDRSRERLPGDDRATRRQSGVARRDRGTRSRSPARRCGRSPTTGEPRR